MVPGSTREAGPWRCVMMVLVPTAVLVGYFSCLYEILPTIVSTESGGIAIANLDGPDYVGGEPASSTELPIELPDRIIAVFGLESSGTTFVTAALKVALGAVGKDELHCRANRTELQHVSLPWGWWRRGRPRGSTVETIPFFPPHPCLIDFDLAQSQIDSMRKRGVPKCCWAVNVTEYPTIPQRFQVNITSHIRWHRSFGIEATAVVVVRDDHMHMPGKIKHSGPQKAPEEDRIGKRLIANAMEELESPSEIVLVSYESMMSLRAPYLFNLYRKLGLESTYVPEFKDGNVKYVDPKYLHLPIAI